MLGALCPLHVGDAHDEFVTLAVDTGKNHLRLAMLMLGFLKSIQGRCYHFGSLTYQLLGCQNLCILIEPDLGEQVICA